jgi:hypothetical protein
VARGDGYSSTEAAQVDLSSTAIDGGKDWDVNLLILKNGLKLDFAPCPKSADIVAKVFLG